MEFSEVPGVCFAGLGKEQRNIYLKIREVLYSCKECFPLTVQPTEMNGIIQAVLTDNPELFWFEGKWSADGAEGEKVGYPLYSMPGELIPDAVNKVRRLLSEFGKQEFESSTDAAKKAYLWILENVSYGTGSTSGQTAYDALVRGNAVCKGISKAYQLILKELGITSTLMEGTLDGTTRHIWNMVWLEDRWAHVDLCMGYEAFSGLFDENERGSRLRGFAPGEDWINRTYGVYVRR